MLAQPADDKLRSRQYLAVGGGFPHVTVDTMFTLPTYLVAGRYQWANQEVARESGIGARVVGILANQRTATTEPNMTGSVRGPT
jgi:hypothetical protein